MSCAASAAIYKSCISANVFLMCHPRRVAGINPVRFFFFIIFFSKITLSLENSNMCKSEK